MYNYGYRDYKPEQARFTTVDPIRDGANWFNYVNNDPISYVDSEGLFPQAIAGAIIGFVVSAATEVGSRMVSGQSFTQAVSNTVHSPTAMANIGVSTVMGAITAGASAAAIKATTSTIQIAAGIGANTVGKQAVATVAINTISGGLGAAVNDVVTKAATGKPQNPVETLEKAVLGATIALAGSALSQGAIASNTNAHTYTYNGLDRVATHAPQWSGAASALGESLAPAAADIMIGITSSKKSGSGGGCGH